MRYARSRATPNKADNRLKHPDLVELARRASASISRTCVPSGQAGCYKGSLSTRLGRGARRPNPKPPVSLCCCDTAAVSGSRQRGGEAGFRAAVDGEIVDAASRADPGEHEWTTRSVAIPNLGSRRATLEFQITVSSN